MWMHGYRCVPPAAPCCPSRSGVAPSVAAPAPPSSASTCPACWLPGTGWQGQSRRTKPVERAQSKARGVAALSVAQYAGRWLLGALPST